MVVNFQDNVLPKARSFNGKMNDLLKLYVEGFWSCDPVVGVVVYAALVYCCYCRCHF